MQNTNDLNVIATTPLTPPSVLKERLPMTEAANRTVLEGRQAVQRILDRTDRRMLVVVGPCSIHDPQIALDYAQRLKGLSEEVSDSMLLVMRVYFEKPRTTVGWKGLINDPDLDGSHKMEKGIRLARQILLEVNEMGVPAATETLDPITPQYLAELIAWSAIGARTTESQTHREMASGLSMPIGFKNGTDGSLDVAINAMQAAQEPHHFLGIDPQGNTAVIQTRGNRYGHIVLRGGKNGPNFNSVFVKETEAQLEQAGLPGRIMIDCNHANSGKDPYQQPLVMRDLIHQIDDGNQSIIGVMIESNLEGGNQKVSPEMKYGVSITDACIDWGSTRKMLLDTHHALQRLQT
ncbi:MAG: 3-deoxy-7-phosphoheptulonate synthase [bacterium]|jgi:3-deoxy-7-phosphoheptulonate synthase